MEVKLIAADGCWKIQSFPENTVMPHRDIEMLLMPMHRLSRRTESDPGYVVTMQKRRYSYFCRDDHGMPIYKESI